MLGIAVIFIIRLFSMQILNKSYKQFATRNVLRRITVFPARGFIYDRKMNFMVYNKAAYDLLVVPREVKPFDTTEPLQYYSIGKSGLEGSIKKSKTIFLL